MESIWKNKKLWKKIGILAGVYFSMKYLVPLVIPFLIAGLIVCGCWPLLCGIQKRLHIRKSLTMAVLLLATAAFLAAGIYLLGKELGHLLIRFCAGVGYRGELERFLYDCCDSVSGMLHMDSSGLRVFVTEQLNLFFDNARQNVLPGAFGESWRFIKGAGSWAAAVLVTGISVLLLADDLEQLKETARQWPFYERAAGTVKKILSSVGGYLKAQAIIMGIIMLLCIAGIWISGSAGNPVLAGIGTGFLDAFPVFGTGTVFLPWILIRVLQGEYISAAVLAATYGICFLTRELLEPKLIGDRLGLLPVVILVSIYAGVKLYGFGGILLGPFSLLLIRELWTE